MKKIVKVLTLSMLLAPISVSAKSWRDSVPLARQIEIGEKTIAKLENKLENAITESEKDALSAMIQKRKRNLENRKEMLEEQGNVTTIEEGPVPWYEMTAEEFYAMDEPEDQEQSNMTAE